MPSGRWRPRCAIIWVRSAAATSARAMFKAGAFNYKLSETGRQGDLVGGGLTGGYILPLGKRLALDFSLGLGCLHADCEKYRVIDGVRVRQGSETRNWWGPVHAGISLKWNLF